MSPEGAIDPVVMLNATNAASNGRVDPATVVAVAKTAQSVDEATTNISAIAHAGNIVKLYDTMKSASPSQQSSGWQGLTPAEQESLKSIGYQPPKLDALSHAGAGGQHGSIWSSIASGIGDGLHDVAHVASDVPHAATDTLNALGSPLRLVQHISRAGNALQENIMHDQQGMSWSQIAGKSSGSGVDLSQGWSMRVFSPSSWSQGWDETNNGNTTLDPAQNHVLVNKYGQKQVSLALQVANQGADAVVQAAPASQRPALINQVRDPKFNSLVTQVSNARVSLGRQAVGSAYMDKNPARGKLLSGSIDAGMDILSDPTMKLGKASEALKIARYGVSDSSQAADLIRSSAGVDRLAQRVAPLLEQGRYGELAKVDPRLDNIASDLEDMKVDSASKFKDYLANTAGQAAILSGRAAKISHGVAIVPHLTYLGWMKSGVKDALSATIDRLADGKVDTDLSKIGLDGSDVNGAGEGVSGHANTLSTALDLLSKGKLAGQEGRIPGVSNVARLVRRTSTLVPAKSFINIADTTRDENGIALDSGPDVTNFRRYVQGFLPAKMTDQLANVFLNSDEGERRQLVTAAIKQNFHAQGLYKTDEGADAADAYAAAQDDLMRKQRYSVNGLDKLNEDDGMPTNHALLETQKAKGMAIPAPKVVRQMVRDHGIRKALGISAGQDLVDKIMSVWRASVLDRFGFAGRMALDENGNRLLRTNPKALLGSFMATGAAPTRSPEDIAAQVQRELEDGTTLPEDAVARNASLKGLANKPLLPYHPAERAFHILSEHVPEGMKPYVDTPAKWYGAVFGGLARGWARNTERAGMKAFGMEKYINAATDLATHQPVMDAANEVLARGVGSDGFGWSAESQVRQMKLGGKSVIAKFNPRAPFSEATPGDFGFNFKWQVGLDQIANSKLGRAALETVDKDRRTSVNAVKGVLNDPSFAAEKKGFVWAKQLRDGRRVGVGATQDEADTAFARQIVDHVNAHLRSGPYKSSDRGPLLQKLVDHILKTGSAPDMETLEGVAGKDLPNAVYGPDVVPVNPFSGFFTRSFEEMVGRPMNWMARQPHFIHQYADALDQTRPFAERIIPSTEQYMKEVRTPVPDTIEHVTRTLNPDEVPESDYYHGTKHAWEDHAPGDAIGMGRDAGASNLFGPGLYMTDSKDVALSYVKKGARRGETSKTVYGLRMAGGKTPKFLDLEKPLPPNVRSIFKDILDRKAASPVGDYDEQAMTDLRHELSGDTSLTGADVYKEFKQIVGEGQYKYDVDEDLIHLHDQIQGLGYDGFRYEGGVRTNNPIRHNAYVVFPDHASGLPPVEVSHVSTAEKTEELVTHNPAQVVRHLARRDLDPTVVNARREKLASDLAAQRAVNAMIPYIHNPELRTQFEDYHRNLFPFLFAQRQFLQRWGRTFVDSPSAIRELQLTMNGLRTSGIVKRDAQGDDYFYYPGSQYVTEMITGTLNQLGIHSTVPFVEPFTGQVKYLMPGLANPVTPSVGPFAAVGMKETEKILPEMAGFNNAVLGQGSTEGPVQQFLPTIVNRLYDALGPQQSGSELASTMAMGMKYLDATGHGLPNNPTRGQTEQYVARVQNWARSLLVARAMLGFVLPATPTAGLDPAGLDARYKTLLSELPYEQATTQFIKEHPDASAYTVGSTEGSTEGGLPSTAQDLAWTNQNLNFTENYPAAAPWLAPRSPGSFSLTEFQEQLDTGERQSKPIYDATPGSHSVVTDIINARASGAYYTTVDNYEAAYSAAGDSATRSQLTNQYDQWKADFFKRNPIFQEYIASEAGHVSRITTINQVNQALKDPSLPKSGVTDDLKAVVSGFDDFQSQYTDVTGSGSQAYDQKQALKANMLSWISTSAQQAPDVADFLNTIIRPEVDEQTG